MTKVIDIQDRLNDPNRIKNKDTYDKNIDIKRDEVRLIPRENKILLEIIEEETFFLGEELQQLLNNQDHIEGNEEIIEVKELQEYFLLFESINEKVKDGFGLDFLPDLTLRELANLAAAVEEKLESLELEGGIFNKADQEYKKELDDLHDKLMSRFIVEANSTGLDPYDGM